MKNRVFLVLLLLLSTFFFSEDIQNTFNFDKIYEIAISNNLNLKSYENQMKIAKLNYDQAVSNLYFPSISLNSSTSIPFDTSKNTNASLNLNISKPIFNGFNLQKAKDIAYINYQYKKSIYQSKIAETKYLAFQYYYQYLVKLLNYKLYSQMVTINEKRLAEYDAKYKLGLITELDFLSLKLTFSKVETSFKNAENEKDIAYLTLKSFLNLKDDFKIEEENDIENIDFTKIFNDNQIKIDESGQINLNEINLIEEAKKYDLSYLSALSSYLNCQINLKYYLASLFPSLSSSLGISYSGIFKDGSFNEADPSFSISFSLSLDLDSLIAGSSKSIEKKQLEKELENAKINLLKAENDLSLSIKTKIKNIILSNQTVQNALNSFNYAENAYKLAQIAVETAKVSMEKAETNLENTILRSPIDGFILERNVDEGDYISTNVSQKSLFVVCSDLSRLKITATVDESDISFIKEGQKVSFTVLAYDNMIFNGFVKQIRLNANESSNAVTYTVIIETKNIDNKLLPGMTASIEFLNEAKEVAFLVPQTAIALKGMALLKNLGPYSIESKFFQNNGQNSNNFQGKNPGNIKIIWIIDETKKIIYPLPVKIGNSDGKMIEVYSDRLTEGMKIISSLITPNKNQNSNFGMPPIRF